MSADRAAFDALYQRYFLLEGLTADDLERLHAAWRKVLADPSQRRGQARAFEPENRIGCGSLWWEERQAGRGEMLVPISELDHAAMIAFTHGHLRTPRARPYTPAEWVGSWRVTSAARDGRTFAPVADGMQRELRDDGSLLDPRHEGWNWRIHLSYRDQLWLGPPRKPRNEIWLVMRRAANTADLVPPMSTGLIVERWQRIAR